MQDRVSCLADGRRMVRLTGDEIALIKMVCRIQKDPPWNWSQQQSATAVRKLQEFSAKKKPCRMIDFLQYYNLRSLLPDICFDTDGCLVAIPPTPIDQLAEVFLNYDMCVSAESLIVSV